MARCWERHATFALAGLVGAGALGGCSDEGRSCTLVACGSTMSVPLVDDRGALVAARGEHRSNQEPDPRPFDCTVAPLSNSLDSDCTGGTLQLGVPDVSPTLQLELRFRLADESWTEWRAVEVAYEPHTDPDFNGPGCSCTWYTAEVTPVLVPADARITGPDAQ